MIEPFDTMVPVSKGTVTTNELLAFMQEHMATKEDLGRLGYELRDYIGRRLTDTEHRLLAIDRRTNKKLDLVVDGLEQQDVFDEREIAQLRSISVFDD